MRRRRRRSSKGTSVRPPARADVTVARRRSAVELWRSWSRSGPSSGGFSGRKTLTTLTGVVLGFVVIAGAYLGALDAIFSRLIQALL
jgi:hypothetical protein